MKKSLKKVSFDFDSTLTEKHIEELASELIDKGYEVHITTSRYSNDVAREKGHPWVIEWNKDLFETAERLQIKHINFTNMKDKIKFLRDKNFIFHLDDDIIEVETINEDDDICEGICINELNWKEKAYELLKNF